jgi:hypothetical protein
MTRRQWAAALSGLLALATAVLLPAATARAATVWVWPSVQCNGTLQQCVDLAASDDEVLIEQSGAINESITVADKSLTLEAEAGFSPKLNFLEVKTTVSDTSVRGFLVKDVQVAGSLYMILEGAAPATVVLDHVSATSSGGAPGIYGNVFGGSTITVENSTISQTGSYPGIILNAANGMSQNEVWDVVGNTISGDLASLTQAGIYIAGDNAKSIQAGIFNNSIWDVGQGESSGDHGGMILDARGTGSAQFHVVGNSIDRAHGNAVTVVNELEGGGPLGLEVFNNVFSNTSGAAVNLRISATNPAPYVTDGVTTSSTTPAHPIACTAIRSVRR